jgi:hypothetical protein
MWVSLYVSCGVSKYTVNEMERTREYENYSCPPSNVGKIFIDIVILNTLFRNVSPGLSNPGQ